MYSFKASMYPLSLRAPMACSYAPTPGNSSLSACKMSSGRLTCATFAVVGRRCSFDEDGRHRLRAASSRNYNRRTSLRVYPRLLTAFLTLLTLPAP